jgi:hypothetical protein
MCKPQATFFYGRLNSYLVGDKNINRVPQKGEGRGEIERGEVMAPIYTYLL